MSEYKVIALSCGSDIKSTIFQSGDIVTDEDFAEGTPDQLVKEKFLEPIEEEKIEPEKSKIHNRK